jgi:ABC-type nitrate/sulfonate/bicarbonate transport system permease component
MRSVSLRVLQQLWLPAVLFAVAWVATANSTSLYVPPLRDVLHDVWTLLTEGRLLSDLRYSLTNLFAGYAIGVAAAVLLGLVIGQNERLHVATRGLLDFARATPQLAFVPVLILALGIGAGPKVFAIALASLWPTLLNTITGVRGVSPAVLETARAYRIPARLRFRKVVLPGAAPQIFAGARAALAVAIIVTVVSEMYGSTQGIGFFVLQSGQHFAVLDTWAGTLVIGVVGYLLSLAMLAVENLSLRWYHRPKENI